MSKGLQAFLIVVISLVVPTLVLLVISLATGGAFAPGVALLLGGAGQHEKMHLLQARIFGPLYLPFVGASYVITFLLQVLWTITLGAILKLAGVRQTAYLRPPARSAVGGFFGWIYYATPIELWAYASGNP